MKQNADLAAMFDQVAETAVANVNEVAIFAASSAVGVRMLSVCNRCCMSFASEIRGHFPSGSFFVNQI
jgi:hypothetical protein